jgi:predicted nucleic acid-binding protein
VIAVDTNVLVYAHVDSSQCLVEFLRLVTHPRVLADPFTMVEATDALSALLESPTASVLCPAEQHWHLLQAAARDADARGNLAFDATIAAICEETGVTVLLTEDRDFARFERVTVRRLK